MSHEKTGEAKMGRTSCDRCVKPATQTVGSLVLCKEHADAERTKQAQVALSGPQDIKSAGIDLRDKHEV
jgi:hypothetical protein